MRVIQNYLPGPTTDPDKRTAPNTWEFNPTQHGADNDENVITEYRYDKVGRQIEVINPLGHADSQSYDKAGQIIGKTDALEHETLFFYDRAGRLLKVIQAYQPQPIVGNPVDDPAYWYWDAATGQWRDMRGDIVEHGTDNARNLIVLMTYDKAGRMLTRREPRGNLTQFTYDRRDRRRTLTNPLNMIWETQYSYLSEGRTRESRIFPGLNGGSTPYTVQRDADRAGRVESVQYGDAATTPNVILSYTLAGQRSLMDEAGASGSVRTTEYTYDKAHRLTQARFDVDGSSTYDETVEYTYDAGGLRTQLKVVSDGNRTINYTYDAKGQPSAMSYVAGKESGVSLLSSAEMTFTKSGWLKRLDRNPTNDILSSRYAYDPAGRLLQIQHIFDDANVLAQFDYTVNALGNRTQALERWLPNASDPMVERTIQYAYDSASRLTGAIYYPNLTGSGSPLHTYGYTYDWSGNRLTETLDTVTRSFGYNAANQLTSEGATTLTYDLNGNLLNDGTNAYTWDRANRLVSMGGVSYSYDGDGDRHSRTVSGTLTRYLMDKQTPLTLVLAETTSGATTRYLHGPTGIFGQQDNTQAANWGTQFMLQDGLSSVRAVSDGMSVLSAQAYSPYGEPLETVLPSDFGFTGEQTDPLNDLVYLRARYLNPLKGVFVNRDSFPGDSRMPMSLNRYGWVEGNVPNRTDPSGMMSLLDLLISTVLNVVLPIVTAAQTTPVPASEPPVQVFFGGSQGENVDLRGTNPYRVNPLYAHNSDIVIRYPGVPSVELNEGLKDFEKDILRSIGMYDAQGKLIYTDADGQYLTGKRLQAKLAAQQLIQRGITTQDISLIGYSAGADAAMIFMDEYVDELRQSGWTGNVSDIVIIGGTATGGMSGGRALQNEWSKLANSIVIGGTDILVVDDNADNVYMPSSYPQPSGLGVGSLTYYPVDLSHSEEYISFESQVFRQAGIPGFIMTQSATASSTSLDLYIYIMNWMRDY